MRALLPFVCLLAACVTPVAIEPTFRMEPRPTYGEVRVMPMLALYEPPSARVDGYVDSQVSWLREAIRRERNDALLEVPDAVALSLPGSLHAGLDGRWNARFLVGRYPAGAREKLVASLSGRRAVDEVLAEIAENAPGEAILVTWVRDLAGDPLTTEAFPGEIVETLAGPVVVDTRDEPYRVRARLGMALVSRDGEVVIRYEDTFEAVLSASRSSSRAGRDLASALAREIVPMFPDDPRFLDGEPPLVRGVARARW